jgi:hypothetical protein
MYGLDMARRDGLRLPNEDENAQPKSKRDQRLVTAVNVAIEIAELRNKLLLVKQQQQLLEIDPPSQKVRAPSGRLGCYWI